MDLLLPQICPITKPEQYKLHLACWNGDQHPLDVFVRDRTDWDGWNTWRGARDDFSRDFIFTLIDFYPENDRWLFGGAYKVLSRKAVKHAVGYKVERLPHAEPFVGRLKIALKRPSRGRALNFENHYQGLIVAEILPEPYSGESFCGYDQIDIGFPMLENVIRRQRADWRADLENAKGVYLITDTTNGKRYVGSAYGAAGIWSRWECYVQTGHGYNDELTKLIRETGIDYARKAFRFALLEYCNMKADDHTVIQREKYWKDVLLSRGKYGYNKN